MIQSINTIPTTRTSIFHDPMMSFAECLTRWRGRDAFGEIENLYPLMCSILSKVKPL